MPRQWFWGVLKYGFGLALLGWVIWSQWDPPGEPFGLRDLAERPIFLPPLLLAFALGAVSITLTFVRWYVLVRAQDLPFQFPEALRLGLIGYALSILLPGAIGGDVVKAACLARVQSRRTVAVATVLFDRIMGLCGLFALVAVLGLVFWWAGSVHGEMLEALVLTAWGFTAGAAALWLVLGLVPPSWKEPVAARLLHVRKIGPHLAELWRTLWMYHSRGWYVLAALGLAMLSHSGMALTFYFAVLALFPAADLPSLASHFLIVPFGLLIQAVFPTPSGLGGMEYGFKIMYEQLGALPAVGVFGALMLRVIGWLIAGTGYVVYLRMRPSSRPELSPATAESLAAEAAS